MFNADLQKDIQHEGHVIRELGTNQNHIVDLSCSMWVFIGHSGNCLPWETHFRDAIQCQWRRR